MFDERPEILLEARFLWPVMDKAIIEARPYISVSLASAPNVFARMNVSWLLDKSRVRSEMSPSKAPASIDEITLIDMFLRRSVGTSVINAQHAPHSTRS